jgi:hypothetical protein
MLVFHIHETFCSQPGMLLGAVQLRLQLHNALAADTCR